MVVYVLLTALSLALAYEWKKAGGRGARRGSRGYAAARLCFLSIYLVLLVPAVLRQATGNDYMRYVEFYHLVVANAMVPTEEGFNMLTRLVYGLSGYENYLLMFAIFSAATIMLFLLAIRDQAQDFFFSFFLFMMFGYYFQSFNTVRYYFALALSFYALRFFMDRQYPVFVLLVLAASTFHKSALVVLALYPLAALVWSRWFILAAGAAGAVVLAGKDIMLKVLLVLYPSWEDTQDLLASGGVSWANIAKCCLVLALAALAWRRAEVDFSGRTMRFYLHATMISLWLYVFGSFIPEVSRICYYLMITQILWIPGLISAMKLPAVKRRCLVCAVGCAAVASFAAFLGRADDSRIRILPYQTFLFHDLPGTPSRSIE